MTADPGVSYMLRKLYALVSGSCSADNPDSPQHQEVLLPGHLYGMIIKERLEEVLNQVRNQIATDVRRAEPPPDFLDSASLLHASLSEIHDWCRAVHHESRSKGQLGYWLKDVQFPCHWKFDFTLRSRSTTGLRFHYCCREAQLVTLYQPFQMHTPWCILCRTQNNNCAEASPRSMG